MSYYGYTQQAWPAQAAYGYQTAYAQPAVPQQQVDPNAAFYAQQQAAAYAQQQAAYGQAAGYGGYGGYDMYGNGAQTGYPQPQQAPAQDTFMSPPAEQKPSKAEEEAAMADFLKQLGAANQQSSAQAPAAAPAASAKKGGLLQQLALPIVALLAGLGVGKFFLGGKGQGGLNTDSFQTQDGGTAYAVTDPDAPDKKRFVTTDGQLIGEDQIVVEDATEGEGADEAAEDAHHH